MSSFPDDGSNQVTQVIFANEARKKLYEGLKIAADAVGCTLGPRGKTVLIQKKGAAPLVTKDGVTVSKSINLHDPVMRMGADLVKEAASKTNDIAGDGTTTATILTHSMVYEGLKLLSTGCSALELKRGILIACDEVCDQLLKSAKQVSTNAEIEQIATISANGSENIGKVVAKAMEKVGRDGVITVEDAKSTNTTLEIVEGMQFERGYLSPYFVTHSEKMHALYDNARLLVTDKKIEDMQELVPLLEQVANARQPLLIIADDVTGTAIQALVLNRVKGQLAIIAVKAPGYGNHRNELLNDICTMTGATLVSARTGVSLKDATLNNLGTCKKIVVDAKTTTLVGTGQTKKATLKHIDDLKAQLSDVTLDIDAIIKLKTRIANLANGVAIIRVGGSTEVEMVERKYRIEDALHATRAAADEGIIPGGGAALYEIGQRALGDALALLVRNNIEPNDDVLAGIGIVRKACEAPLNRIVENAGQHHAVIKGNLELHKKELSNKNIVYNARANQYVDAFVHGIIDPVKVTRAALKNASSVATTFLSLDAVVYECEEK